MVGITADLIELNGRTRLTVALAYAEAVRAAGGIPVVIPPMGGTAQELIYRLQAFVFTGGDDPATEPFGAPTHPEAKLIHPDRQAFAVELLTLLRDEYPTRPVLGVCLGMQLMALVAGGSLHQHMPESHPDSHAAHMDADHEVRPVAGDLIAPDKVHSWHHQCVDSPGSLRVTAEAPDGVIEAVDDPNRRFYVGVQWHPERTSNRALGQAMFERLVAEAR